MEGEGQADGDGAGDDANRRNVITVLAIKDFTGEGILSYPVTAKGLLWDHRV